VTVVFDSYVGQLCFTVVCVVILWVVFITWLELYQLLKFEIKFSIYSIIFGCISLIL